MELKSEIAASALPPRNDKTQPLSVFIRVISGKKKCLLTASK